MDIFSKGDIVKLSDNEQNRYEVLQFQKNAKFCTLRFLNPNARTTYAENEKLIKTNETKESVCPCFIENAQIDVLPLDVLKYLFDFFDLCSQIDFRKTCKFFYENLKIRRLWDIPLRASFNLTDQVLKLFPQLTALDAGFAHITDEGLKTTPLITHLKAGCNITDEGLKSVPLLTYLDASGVTCEITFRGLSAVPLLTYLDASRNHKISNKGLPYVPLLTTLIAQNNYSITPNKLKNMKYLVNISPSRLRGK